MKVPSLLTVSLVLVLQLLPSGVCLYVRPEDDGELWLEDYTRGKEVSGDVQSDSPRGSDEEEEEPQECPTVSSPDADVSTLTACLLPKCDADVDCELLGQKCCFNGCLDTCVAAVPPPPFVDWRQEPIRDPLTGVSWLIKDDEEEEASQEILHKADHCSLHGRRYTDGQLFEHDHHQCLCQKGLVQCNVKYEKVVLDHIQDKFV